MSLSTTPVPSLIGKKIQVIGAIGSGKSTTALRIAERLGLPFIDLDSVRHQPGWTEKPVEDFRKDVLAALDGTPTGWVVSGNYFSALGESVISRAETVIWLRIPFRRTFPKLFLRTVRRSWTKEPLWNGNHESWRVSFFSRNSVLLEAISKAPDRHHREYSILQRLAPQPMIVEVTKFSEIDRFIESLAPRLIANREVPMATDS
jgi:adenylate kinase family enzyme